MTLRSALVLIFALCLLIGIAPILSAFVASGIAEVTGCNVNEGGSNPCLIFGIDWGGLLNIMFVSFWFFFFTFPLAVVGVLGLVIMGILQLFRAFRR